MPAKITFISLIHSIVERDTLKYTIREANSIVRKENNATMNIKVIAFFLKDESVPRQVPLFEPVNVLRFTGKFAIDDQSPNDALLEVKNNIKQVSEVGSCSDCVAQ